MDINMKQDVLGQDLLEQLKVPQGSIQHDYRDFVICFYRRFVCGGDALTKLRSVSRKRLELVKLNLSDDIEAKCLLVRINAYNRAVESFCKSDVVSTKDIENIHKQLTNSRHKAGGFRTVQNWIGSVPAGTPLKKALKQAAYIPPAPEIVAAAMECWCQQASKFPEISTEQIVALYANLVLIHPFADANGRIARAFCEAMLTKAGICLPSVALRRLQISPQDYFSALYTLDGVYSPESLEKYWQTAIDFSFFLLRDASCLLRQCAKSLEQRLMLSKPARLELDLIKHLIQQPILEPVSYQIQNQISPAALRNALNKLLTVGVLQSQLTPNHQKVFVCEIVLDAWQKMDELAFTNTQLAPTLN